ncbi:hypothetical protein [uncultured Clostridium sp.]|uniref:hypothetical protein n=1 Tax=uncultured Clostridium sp. TaxID=59620 RepID=UPI0027DC8FD1|nr:hypothetical protein [uncultured Clostridium sp.]
MNVVMNHNQYIEWKYGEKTTLDIKLENLGIKNKRRLRKELVIGLAVGGFLINYPSLAFGIDLGAIDKLGNTFLSIVRKASYWIVLILSLVEISKAALKGGNSSSEIGKIIVKYLLIYASLFLMPWLFDLVEEAFR